MTLATNNYHYQFKPSDWLASYVATYLERDVRSLSNIGDLTTFQRFAQLCAGRVSQLLNLSSLAADCGVSQRGMAATKLNQPRRHGGTEGFHKASLFRSASPRLCAK